jgi:hypothetical protein
MRLQQGLTTTYAWIEAQAQSAAGPVRANSGKFLEAVP